MMAWEQPHYPIATDPQSFCQPLQLGGSSWALYPDLLPEHLWWFWLKQLQSTTQTQESWIMLSKGKQHTEQRLNKRLHIANIKYRN